MDTSGSSQSQNSSSESTPIPDLSHLMNASMDTTSPPTNTDPPSEDTPHIPNYERPKKSNKGILIALILFVLISLPIVATIVIQTQSRNSIADLRSKAIAPGDSCTGDNVEPVCDAGNKYECITTPYGSSWQLTGTCSLTPTGQQCIGMGQGCANQGGNITCCEPGSCVLAVPAQGIYKCGLPNGCYDSGNSASACNGKNPGDDVGPCTCQRSSLGGRDCACIADTNPSPTPTVPPGCSNPNGSTHRECVGNTCQTVNNAPGVCDNEDNNTCDNNAQCTNNPTSPPNPTNTPQPTATRTPTPTVGPSPTAGPSPTPTNTPIPTNTPVIGQCQNIKIYKNGVVVVPSTLLKGDNIVIAVVGTNATQARIKINGEPDWRISTTTNSSGEWVFDYQIPNDGTLTFSIVAELLIAGVWQ